MSNGTHPRIPVVGLDGAICATLDQETALKFGAVFIGTGGARRTFIYSGGSPAADPKCAFCFVETTTYQITETLLPHPADSMTMEEAREADRLDRQLVTVGLPEGHQVLIQLIDSDGTFLISFDYKGDKQLTVRASLPGNVMGDEGLIYIERFGSDAGKEEWPAGSVVDQDALIASWRDGGTGDDLAPPPPDLVGWPTKQGQAALRLARLRELEDKCIHPAHFSRSEQVELDELRAWRLADLRVGQRESVLTQREEEEVEALVALVERHVEGCPAGSGTSQTSRECAVWCKGGQALARSDDSKRAAVKRVVKGGATAEFVMDLSGAKATAAEATLEAKYPMAATSPDDHEFKPFPAASSKQRGCVNCGRSRSEHPAPDHRPAMPSADKKK